MNLTGLRVATARVSYRGPGRLDITVRGDDPIGSAWAPTWAMVKPIIDLRRAGRVAPERLSAAWESYVSAYEKLLDERLSSRRSSWEYLEMTARGGDLVVGVCYCAGEEAALQRCHRFLWAERLVQYGAIYEGELAEGGGQRELFARRP